VKLPSASIRSPSPSGGNHSWISGGGSTGTSVTVIETSVRAAACSAASGLRAWISPIVPPRRSEHRSSSEDDAHGRVHLLAFANTACAERAARDPDGLRIDRRQDAARSERSGNTNGARGRIDAGSSVTRGSPPCASIIRANRSDAWPSSNAAAARALASSKGSPPPPPAPAPRTDRQITEAAMPGAAQHFHGFDDVQGVPIASPSGWDMSVIATPQGRPSPRARARHASARSRARAPPS